MTCLSIVRCDMKPDLLPALTAASLRTVLFGRPHFKPPAFGNTALQLPPPPHSTKRVPTPPRFPGRADSGSSVSNRDEGPAARGSSGRRYVCRSCGKVFSYGHSMVRHRRKCEGSPSHRCQFCSKQFHRRDLYREHLASHHHVTEPPRHRLQPVWFSEDRSGPLGACQDDVTS
ncbi:hypothetical protein V1264_013650 [Littorina saxatilis]|uniref:C2H2-type domain-containing protein n=1 Tax=Littorina saxatilis TaxID=31220 RepID=A0AAN9BNM4_9CAEN